jgi:hypothetical protein
MAERIAIITEKLMRFVEYRKDLFSVFSVVKFYGFIPCLMVRVYRHTR